jgi:hypothetical protein
VDLYIHCPILLHGVVLNWLSAGQLYLFLPFIVLSAVEGERVSPLVTSGTIWSIVPAPDDNDECGALGGMRIGRGNQSTRRKLAQVPLCPPQIPHDLTWARTRAAAVGSRR